jgi:hypothetical protein
MSALAKQTAASPEAREGRKGRKGRRAPAEGCEFRRNPATDSDLKPAAVPK